MIPAAVRLEREKRKTAREERLWNLLMDPTVKRMLLLSLIVAYTSYANTHSDKMGAVGNALAVALPTAGVPMLAAEAGVTDWRVLAALALGAGGVAALTNESAVDAVTISGPGDFPVLSLLGPLAGLSWIKQRLAQLS